MKIYIETTVPSFYHDTRRSLEVRSRRLWTRQWWDAPKPDMTLVTGFSVLAELAMTPGRKRAKALEMARSLPVLEDSEEVQEVVEFYALHKLMPAGIFGDAHPPRAGNHEQMRVSGHVELQTSRQPPQTGSHCPRELDVGIGDSEDRHPASTYEQQ